MFYYGISIYNTITKFYQVLGSLYKYNAYFRHLTEFSYLSKGLMYEWGTILYPREIWFTPCTTERAVLGVASAKLITDS